MPFKRMPKPLPKRPPAIAAPTVDPGFFLHPNPYQPNAAELPDPPRESPPKTLLHCPRPRLFIKSHIHHNPSLSHLDFHLFRYAASLDTFRHDHSTFEWMTRSLAASYRLDSLNSLIQFMASNPCPCADGIFSCPKTDPIFRVAINAYCRAGSFDGALFAFDTMKRLIDGKPDVALYNIVIHGFVKFRRYDKALELYERMVRDRVKPDVITFNTLISGYCRNSQFELALEIFKEMKNKGCVPNVVSFNTLMKGFFREGKIDEGIGIAHEMIELGCDLSSVTCEILVDGLYRGGRVMEVCDLLIDFSRKRVLPSGFDWCGPIEMLCREGNARRPLEVVYELWRNGCAPSLSACITLIEGLRQTRKIREAFTFVERMLRESILPDSVTFNCLLGDMCDTGRSLEANKLRLLATGKGLDPDGMTYRILISGYGKEARKKEGEVLVDEMLDRGFIADIATYNRLMNELTKLKS